MNIGGSNCAKVQQGSEIVEFSVVALLFFIVLFLIIECARLMFTMNSLAEAVWRGARVATVCPPNDDAIKKIAVFSTPSGPNFSPIIHNLDTSDVTIDYRDENGVSTTPSVAGFVNISIAGFEHQVIVPMLGSTLTFSFEVTLPRESLDLGKCATPPSS